MVASAEVDDGEAVFPPLLGAADEVFGEGSPWGVAVGSEEP